MKVSDKLSDLYAGYYGDANLGRKREITARQTLDHVTAMLPSGRYRTALEVGAGEGSVLAEMDRRGIADNLHAVEISESGCEAIRSRGISRLRSVRRFDGYRIDAETASFDFGLAVHVLEHVEHEREFLLEVARACSIVYVEVPLELTLRVERAIKLSGAFGHINFYTPATFRNLLVTAGLDVLGFRVFSHSLAYETYVGGQMAGRIKYWIRSGALSAAPRLAPMVSTYLAGAVCRRA
jgi:hypothetical protein